jgi:acetyl-CoA carboxylase biotin carboxyl carrier protein
MATRKSEQTERSRESAAEESESGPFTLADVRKLVDALKGTDVTALVWKRGEEKVEIRRGPGSGPVAQVVTQAIPAAPVAAAASAAAAPAAAPAKAPDKPGTIVTSPFVGTFYRAPSPDSPPFVEVGAVVKKGQVLCIVEAMKLMNEIEAEIGGKVAEIFVQNATPVEFGEKLFRIEPA